jgi:hypothetical protein
MADRDRLGLFGIRHHGPGSAAALQRALDALDPAIVLIEGPPEAEPVLPFATAPEMRPPLAILVHDRDRPARARFFPLAAFSPEWRALDWALARGRPVRFIDLSAAWDLAEPAAPEEPGAGADAPPAESTEPTAGAAGEEEPQDGEEDAERLRADPIAALAAAAGYADGETWWNAMIEESGAGPEIFAAIEAAMTALREHAPPLAGAAALREARREAQMRLGIARALKETEGAVAAVVGAWHVPALRRAGRAAEDRALLRGAPRVPVAACWAPWTEPRLAARSGYGAGVLSPAWYAHLAACSAAGLGQRERSAGWLGRAAMLLREAGLPASTAAVIEAVRLGEALASLRGLAAPGLPELREAGLAVLTGGEEGPWQLIERRLVIGEAVGHVDPGAPQPPLLQDLARQQKAMRLQPTGEASEIALDLRSAAGLTKSRLLHRLALLGAPWGRPLDAGRSRGTFRERWSLAWEPGFAVALAEAAVWGTTIAGAAGGALAARAREERRPAPLAAMVGQGLLADLPAATTLAIDRLQAATVATADLGELLATLPPLADTLRYGAARAVAEAALAALFARLIETICVGLPLAARGLDADAAAAFRRQLVAADRAIGLAAEPARLADWRTALGVLVEGEAAPLVAGAAARLLYDAGTLPPDEAGRALGRALSPARPPAEAAAWLEGFLAGGGEVLLHDRPLLRALDAWLCELPEEALVESLPLLRRALGGLDRSQRSRLLEAALAAGGTATRPSAPPDDEDPPGWREALPLLNLILGIGS